MSMGMSKACRRTSAYGRSKRVRLNLYVGTVCLISGLVLVVTAIFGGNM